MPKEKRFGFRISNATQKRIREIHERGGGETMTETVRHALAIYEAVLDARDDGRGFFLEDDEGELRDVFLLPPL